MRIRVADVPNHADAGDICGLAGRAELDERLAGELEGLGDVGIRRRHVLLVLLPCFALSLALVDLGLPAAPCSPRPVAYRLDGILGQIPSDQIRDAKTGDGHTQERQTEQSPRRRACALVELLTEPGAYDDGDRDHDSDLAQDRRVRARSTRGAGCGQVSQVYGRKRASANRATASRAGGS